jgi:hypothetical protein
MTPTTRANGDFDSEDPYASPNANVLDAVLLGPSSDQAAGWALLHETAAEAVRLDVHLQRESASCAMSGARD